MAKVVIIFMVAKSFMKFIRIPAFDLNGYYSITFIIFMILGLFFFNNIVLAAIYANFKKNLKEEVKVSINLRRKKLKEAFNLLKKHSTSYIDEYAIDFMTFERLLRKIYPNKSKNKTKILFNLLDLDEGNSLCNSKMSNVCSFFMFIYLSIYLVFASLN